MKRDPNWRASKWLRLRGLESLCLFIWALTVLYFKHDIRPVYQAMFLALIPPFSYFVSFIYAALTIGLRMPFRFTSFYDHRMMKASMNTAVHIIYGLMLFWLLTVTTSETYFTQRVIDYYMLDWAWLAGIFLNFGAAYYIYRPEVMQECN
ncbi:MAG: hypothetical protein H6912_10280 [Kordiimonadaceae bacterium]|nr:hypothetical protein [Kordiimonadaceae bacterium]